MTHSDDLAKVKLFREKARCNGYPLVRVRSRDKVPVSPGWQNGEADELLLEVTADAANTGLICSGFRIVDVDIDDFKIGSKIAGLVRDHLPIGALVRRRARSPRFALVFRAEGKPKKKSVCGEAGKIEILGDGQQLVIDGVHPSGSPLSWIGGRSPAAIDVSAVPVVSEAQIEELLNECAVILGACPVPPQRNFPRLPDPRNVAKIANDNELAAGIDRGHWFDALIPSRKRELVQFCVGNIDNHESDPRDQWLKILFAVADAGHRGCPDVRELALEWSQRGAGWTSEADFDKAWNSFKAGDITVGTTYTSSRRMLARI